MGEPRTRDRTATAESIVAAAKALVGREGFQAFGVNALAREARCDKQLIYRYFGGLEGVLDALAAEMAAWVGSRLDPLLALGAPASYGELIERLALGLLQAYRDDPLMRQIKAWEFAAPSPALARIGAARGAGLGRWMERARGALRPPEGVDAPALNAFIIASVEAFALTAATGGAVYGAPLQEEKDWDRMRAALKRLIRGVYGDA